MQYQFDQGVFKKKPNGDFSDTFELFLFKYNIRKSSDFPLEFPRISFGIVKTARDHEPPGCGHGQVFTCSLSNNKNISNNANSIDNNSTCVIGLVTQLPFGVFPAASPNSNKVDAFSKESPPPKIPTGLSEQVAPTKNPHISFSEKLHLHLIHFAHM